MRHKSLTLHVLFIFALWLVLLILIIGVPEEGIFKFFKVCLVNFDHVVLGPHAIITGCLSSTNLPLSINQELVLVGAFWEVNDCNKVFLTV